MTEKEYVGGPKNVIPAVVGGDLSGKTKDGCPIGDVGHDGDGRN